MPLRLPASLVLAAGCVLALHGTARAEQPASRPLPQAACELPPPAAAHPLLGREENLSRFERLPPACLKAIVTVCSEEANTGMLDLGTAAVCSMGYEALLRSGFDGDFRALMAWWNGQRRSAQQQP